MSQQMRVAKLSGIVNWSDNTAFEGYAVVGIVLPPTHSYATIAYPSRYNQQRIPQWCTIPISNGVFDNTVGLVYNADVSPRNTAYVIYYYDENGVLIGAPQTTSDYFYATSGTATPPLYTLSPASLNLQIPAPSVTSSTFSEVTVLSRNYTVDFNAPLFATASAEIQIPIFDLLPNYKIWALEVVPTEAFAGTGVTTATLTVGDGTDDIFYLQGPEDLTAAPSATNFVDVSMYKSPSLNSSAMYAVFTFNVNAGDDNTTVLTTGAVRFRITYTEGAST